MCDFSTPFCGSHRPCLRPILGSSLADPAAVTDGMQSKSHVFSEEPYHIHEILDWEILLTRCNLFFRGPPSGMFFFVLASAGGTIKLGHNFNQIHHKQQRPQNMCQAAITVAMRFSWSLNRSWRDETKWASCLGQKSLAAWPWFTSFFMADHGCSATHILIHPQKISQIPWIHSGSFPIVELLQE